MEDELPSPIGPSEPFITDLHGRGRDGAAIPIRRRSLHDEATERLRDMIVEGKLAAGEWINELKLCKQLEISRTPLREALKVLASEGLVELIPRRGAHVAQRSAREIADLFEALSALEGISAELAAVRMSAADVEKLRTLQVLIEQEHRARNRHDYFHDNLALHKAIVACSGNSALAEIHTRLIASVGSARYLAILSELRWSEAVREHSEILAALERRDARRAGELMRQHVHGLASSSTLRSTAIKAANVMLIISSSPRTPTPTPISNTLPSKRTPAGQFGAEQMTLLVHGMGQAISRLQVSRERRADQHGQNSKASSLAPPRSESSSEASNLGSRTPTSPSFT